MQPANSSGSRLSSISGSGILFLSSYPNASPLLHSYFPDQCAINLPLDPLGSKAEHGLLLAAQKELNDSHPLQRKSRNALALTAASGEIRRSASECSQRCSQLPVLRASAVAKPQHNSKPVQSYVSKEKAREVPLGLGVADETADDYLFKLFPQLSANQELTFPPMTFLSMSYCRVASRCRNAR